jgi:uncharacterized protein YlxW (UPF0749 family)
MIFFRLPGEKSKIKLFSRIASKASKTSVVSSVVTANLVQAHANDTAYKVRTNSKVQDRLRSDKAYLSKLVKKIQKRTDIDNDEVQKNVSKEAKEVLGFLKEREIFWDQMYH